MRLGVLGMMMAAMVLLGPRAAFAERYGVALINPDDPEGNPLGFLMVIDGRVFVSNEAGQDGWWIEREEKGYVVRITGRPRKHWYLTGDKQGRVYLSQEPEEGSYWETQIRAGESVKSAFNVRGWKEGPRTLMVEKQASTYTDAAGKKYTVKRVRLMGDEKDEREKMLGFFRVMESSP